MFTQSFRLFYILGLQDIKQRYRRSVIGPLWITFSMALMTVCLGVLYSALFNMPINTFLPFLASGIIAWNLISTCLNESCDAYINAKSLIYQSSVSYWSHILRVIWRNVIIFGHNLIILPILLLIFGSQTTWTVLLAIPGFLLLIGNLIWMCTLLAILSTRFRDVPQIVQSVVQILFFLTPIMWTPSLLMDRSSSFFIELNPFYHLIELVRAPILGNAIHIEHWLISSILLFLGGIFTALVSRKFNHRIPYWL